MNTIYNKITGLAAALLLSASLTSCVVENGDVASNGQKAEGSFTLNITSAPVGTTRAATDISSGTTAQAAAKSADEKSINRFVMAVFDNDDSYANLMGKAVATASGTTFEEQKSFNTGGLADGDSIFVAANIPSAKLSTYKDYSLSQFAETELLINEVLTPGTDGTLDDSDLPMFGKSAVVDEGGGSGNFSATVSLNHLVAKISLNSLSCDFTGTAHTSASFRPTQLFLINVPEKMNMEVTATGGSCFAVANTDFYQGEADSWTTHAYADQRQYADYLGTSVMASEAKITSGNSWNKVYSLFALPNHDATYNTKLVIKGMYSDDGTDANEHAAYYAVTIGQGTTAAATYVQMNTIYKLSVTIKGDGAPDAYSAVPNYQNLTSTITYEDWTEHATTVTAGNGGLSYSTQRAAAIGDLLFSDGSWGTLDEMPGKTPVAIVFSTVTSAADQAAGYNNGYAIALKDVNNSQTMAWSTQSSYVVTGVTPALDISDATKLANYVASATYLDGRSETAAITGAADYSSLVYPAAYAAVTTYESEVAHPTGTSGWYLPSIGQQYEWVKMLGEKTTAPDQWRAQYKDCYWSGAATDVAGKINANAAKYLKTADGTTVDHSAMWVNILGSGGYYWSSTESAYGAGYSFDLNFHTDGGLFLHGSSTKSDTNRRVRPVLAF